MTARIDFRPDHGPEFFNKKGILANNQILETENHLMKRLQPVWIQCEQITLSLKTFIRQQLDGSTIHGTHIMDRRFDGFFKRELYQVGF